MREALARPKIGKLAHASLWEYSYKRLKLAQLLANLGSFTLSHPSSAGLEGLHGEARDGGERRGVPGVGGVDVDGREDRAVLPRLPRPTPRAN